MALDFTVFDQVFRAVDQACQAMAMNFAKDKGLTYTRDIIYVALACEFVVCLILMLTDSGKAALIRLFEAIIPAALIFSLVTNWQTMVVPVPITVSDELVEIASGGQTPAGLGSMIAEKFAPTIRAMSSSLFPSQQQVPSPPAAAGSAPAKSKSLWDTFAGWWDGAPISSLFVGIADSLHLS